MLRTFEDKSLTVVVMANASEGAFSSFWPEGSHPLLDDFERLWPESQGDTERRLECTFDRACLEFLLRASSSLTPDAKDWSDDCAYGTLFAAVVDGDRMHCRWIGDHIAFVLRDFHVAAQTTPHSLREKLRREGRDEASLLNLPNMLTHFIAPTSAGEREPASATFTLAAGDAVLFQFTSGTTDVNPDDLAFLSACRACPQQLAQDVIDELRADRCNFAAACVLRFDNIDVPTTINALIDAYKPPHSNLADLGPYAREHRVLPVHPSLGGAWALTPAATVVHILWDEPGLAPTPSDPLSDLFGLRNAARNHPVLRSLAPGRPTEAQACPTPQLHHPDGYGCGTCVDTGWCVPPHPKLQAFAAHDRCRSETLSNRTTASETPAAATPTRPWWSRWFSR